MSASYFDPYGTEKVTVPVKRVGDHWEFLYGGDVPVEDGTFGELTLSTYRITDEAFRKRITAESTFKILSEGTRLLVALSDKSKGGDRVGPWPEPFPLAVPPGTTRWESVELGPPKVKPEQKKSAQVELLPIVKAGGLWLKLKGLERCELSGSTILMPKGFSTPTATSLNHAFTLLSQEYEKHRISNTGNIYTRVFYQDRNERWYPLDDLRRGVRGEAERQLLKELWERVEQMLGWRPVPAPAQKRGRR